MRPARAQPERQRRCWRAGLALLLLLGCSGEPSTGSGQCPNDLPPSCPATVPSYQNDVMQIVQRACASCHSATGVESNRPLDTYSALYSQRQGVLTQIYSCRMPPAGSPPLTASERQQLLAWLVCQSPNN